MRSGNNHALPAHLTSTTRASPLRRVAPALARARQPGDCRGSRENAVEDVSRHIPVISQPVHVRAADRVAEMAGDSGERRSFGKEGRRAPMTVGVEHETIVGQARTAERLAAYQRHRDAMDAHSELRERENVFGDCVRQERLAHPLRMPVIALSSDVRTRSLRAPIWSFGAAWSDRGQRDARAPLLPLGRVFSRSARARARSVSAVSPQSVLNAPRNDGEPRRTAVNESGRSRWVFA